MKENPWLKALAQLRAAMPECPWPPDNELHDTPDSVSEDTYSFFEQVLHGTWPARLPAVVEMYVEGTRVRCLPLRPGQKRRRADSQIVTFQLEFDQAAVRDMLLECIREPRVWQSSKLPHIFGLVHVDRACFLETAAQHFVETTADGDALLRRDPWLMAFVREMVIFDPELVGDLVAETMRRARLSGELLRDVILDYFDRAGVREQLGWLEAAAIAERLQAL